MCMYTHAQYVHSMCMCSIFLRYLSIRSLIWSLLNCIPSEPFIPDCSLRPHGYSKLGQLKKKKHCALVKLHWCKGVSTAFERSVSWCNLLWPLGPFLVTSWFGFYLCNLMQTGHPKHLKYDLNVFFLMLRNRRAWVMCFSPFAFPKISSRWGYWTILERKPAWPFPPLISV